MSGLEDKLSGILSDPDAVAKLKSLGQALGIDTGTSHTSEKPQSAMQGFNLPFMNTSGDNADMMNTMMRLAPLLSDMSKDDETSCLLNALKPFLSAHRRQRLDQAGKMLKVMKLLPLIKGSGIL